MRPVAGSIISRSIFPTSLPSALRTVLPMSELESTRGPALGAAVGGAGCWASTRATLTRTRALAATVSVAAMRPASRGRNLGACMVRIAELLRPDAGLRASGNTTTSSKRGASSGGHTAFWGGRMLPVADVKRRDRYGLDGTGGAGTSRRACYRDRCPETRAHGVIRGSHEACGDGVGW